MANAIPTITFLNKGYVPHPYSNPAQNADPSVVILADLGGPELVSLHNVIVDNIGSGSKVKRFSDKGAAVSRTWAKLNDYAKTDPNLSPDLAAYLGVTKSEAIALDATDKAAIADEAKSRKYDSATKALQPRPKSEQLLAVASQAGAKAQAQAALRTSPPVSDNPEKDAQMPALRKALKPTNLEPKKTVYARKEGSKQAVLVDLLGRPQGATFGELYDALAATGKAWKGVTIRSGLAWDINHIAGYGVASELLNGEEFAKQGRIYEARRLGVSIGEGASWTISEGYDPELKLAVYRLTYPGDMTAPLPHIGKAKA